MAQVRKRKREQQCKDEQPASKRVKLDGNTQQKNKDIDDDEENEEKAIAECIMALVHKRGISKTICPSEVPRKLYDKNTWRSKMELTRKVAFKLVKDGKIVVKQKGIIIDIDKGIKGPIRLSLP